MCETSDTTLGAAGTINVGGEGVCGGNGLTLPWSGKNCRGGGGALENPGTGVGGGGGGGKGRLETGGAGTGRGGMLETSGIGPGENGGGLDRCCSSPVLKSNNTAGILAGCGEGLGLNRCCGAG